MLDYFKVASPELLEHVYAQVRDVHFDKAESVFGSSSLKDTWHLMRDTGLKTVAVVDDAGRLAGVVTLGDITEAYLEASDGSSTASLMNLPVREVMTAAEPCLAAGLGISEPVGPLGPRPGSVLRYTFFGYRLVTQERGFILFKIW